MGYIPRKKVKSCDPYYHGKRDTTDRDSHDDPPGERRRSKNPEKKSHTYLDLDKVPEEFRHLFDPKTKTERAAEEESLKLARRSPTTLPSFGRRPGESKKDFRIRNREEQHKAVIDHVQKTLRRTIKKKEYFKMKREKLRQKRTKKSEKEGSADSPFPSSP